MPIDLRLIVQILTLCTSVLCQNNVVKIHNESEFLDFIKEVNSGMNYKGTTVFLENALNFTNNNSRPMDPIGMNETVSFDGTFNGQGFSIDYFVVNTTNKYAGLFGYSRGATIKNIFTSSRSSINFIGNKTDDVYVGGFLGACLPTSGHCIVENCVGLAKVTFTGETSGDVYIGGIVGKIESKYESHVRNCVNYGTVKSDGKSNFVYMGGIIGAYHGSSATSITVSNCLNLGSINFTWASVTKWYVGGISGNTKHCSHDNCVASGIINHNNANNVASEEKEIWSLCGKPTSSYFRNCYWNEILGSQTQGAGMDECAPYNSSFNLNKAVTSGNYTGDVLLEALNAAADYYTLYEYSHWGHSVGKCLITLVIKDWKKYFNLDSQLILFPELSSEGSLSFDGWYSDINCTVLWTNYTFNEPNITVYGKWGNDTNTYTISFDLRGGSPALQPLVGKINTEQHLPSNVEKDGCVFEWWENDYGDKVEWDYVIRPRNVTLHAVWCCSKIRSASDLIGLANLVNSGASPDIETVTLESDIEFTAEESNRFKLVGSDDSSSFGGVFDGQGYVIKNLSLKTNSKNSGLFGYSRGATIRNLVMDSSCSVVSTYGSYSNDEESFHGAFIGCCHALNNNCTIENSVNMASVTFGGSTSASIYIGGLAGHFVGTQKYCSNIVNCVNYGTITNTGKTSGNAAIGGLIGECNGDYFVALIFNSINHGMIHDEGAHYLLRIGGIVGYSEKKLSVENCVNFGWINIDPKNVNEYIGTIVGEIGSAYTIKHCYWNRSIEYKPVGNKVDVGSEETLSSFDGESFELTKDVSVGNYKGYSLIEALNSYVEKSPNTNCSKWVLNKNASAVKFLIANRPAPFLVLGSKVILIPNFTKSHDRKFKGWFSDQNCTKAFNSKEITHNTTLYGTWVILSPKKSGSSLSVRAGVAITGCACLVVFVVIGAALFTFYKKKYVMNEAELDEPLVGRNDHDYDDEYCRSVAINEDIESLTVTRSFISPLSNLYSYDYKKPTIEDALMEAGLTEEQAKFIRCACENVSRNVMKKGAVPEGFTEEDAAAIAAYTYDFGPTDFEDNPYRIINKSVAGRDFNRLQKASGLLYLVMTALRKLPRYKGVTLYRGVRSDVKLNESRYRRGNTVVWMALSSTSPDLEATKAFLSRGSKSKEARGTLFIIDGAWGYDIQPYSLFPTEAEILLEPERQFKVTGVIKAALTVINLQMLDTPLSVPEVFGEGTRRFE